jgi:hypothetical protein
MTMPHLQNCDHSDSGWCLDCVKKLQDQWEEKVNLATSCRLQHTGEECKVIGELVSYLEAWSGSTDCRELVLDGKLEVYWNDSVMGTIEGDGDGSFNYHPLPFGQRGEHEKHGKHI